MLRTTGSRASGLLRALRQEVLEGFEKRSALIAFHLLPGRQVPKGQVQTQGPVQGPAAMGQVTDGLDGCSGLVRSGWLPDIL